MSKWWKYAAVGFSGLMLSGMSCGTGYLYGYYKSEPEFSIYDHKKHGAEGLCVEKNAHQRICAYDANDDGAVDIVLYEDGKVTEVKWGEEKCLVPIKSLEEISDEPPQDPGGQQPPKQ